MTKELNRPLVGYAAAAVLAGLALALRLLADRYLVGVQFITFFPAVLVAASLFGSRPGLITAMLCGLAGWYVLIPPTNSFQIEESSQAFTLAAYFVVASAMAMLVGRSRDASHRRTIAERELRDERDRTHRALNSISEGFVLLDRDYRVVQINAEGLRLEKRPASDIIGKTHWEAWPGTEHSEIGRLYKKALSDGVPVSLQHRYEWAEGHEAWLDMRAYPTQDGLTIVYRDISEGKAAELALRKSESEARRSVALLEAIGESSPSLIYAKDRDCRTIYANSACLSVFGKTREEVIGRTSAEIAEGSAEGQAHVRNDRRVIQTGEIETMDETFTTANGVTRTYRSVKAPLRSSEGDIVGIVGVSTDVTDRLRVENELRESRERLDLAVSAHGIGIFDWIVQTGRVIWSEEEERIFGLEPGAFEGQRSGWSSRLVPEDLEAVTASISAAMERQDDCLDFAFRIVRADGEVRHVEGSSRFLYNPDGTPERMVGTNTDVTERVVSAARLQESEARLRIAIDAGHMAVFDHDFASDELRHSPELNRLLDFPSEQHLRMEDVRTRFAPGEVERMRRLRTEALEEGEKYVELEFRTVPIAGKHRWFLLRAETRTDATGAAVGSTGVLLDITERKLAEERVRESEARLNAMVQQMPIGVIIARVPSGEIIVYNRASERIMGHPILGATATEYGTYGALHTDGAAFAAEEYPMARAVLHGEVVKNEDIRYRRPDGRIAHLAVSAARIVGPSGNADLAVCTFDDVTSRKLAEEHQKLLINELNHRTKNQLAIVQSVAQQTFRNAATAEAKAAFEGRLAALAAAHDILTRKSWDHAQLDEILKSALAPFPQAGNDRVSTSGPRVSLEPKTAVSFAMAFHELATNAAKYGALSRDGGRVSIDWQVEHKEAQGRLRVTWREVGGPSVKAPASRGFGSRMIERGLAAELGGEVRISFEPEGVVCEVDAPLPKHRELNSEASLIGAAE